MDSLGRHARRAALFLVLAALAGMGAASGSPGTPRPETVIVMVIDTLRADRLAAWGADPAVMPGLDRWIERAVVFGQARSAAPWTLPSFTSLYTGLYPSRHGAGVKDRSTHPRTYGSVSPDAQLLSERLSDAGWETGAFVANKFLSPLFGLARGFGRYEQAWKSEEDQPIASASVDSALAWIDARDDSGYFLVVHVLDPHLPYDPPPATRGRFTAGYTGKLERPVRGVKQIRSGDFGPEDRGFIEGLHDEDVAFADLQMARFLDGLEARGILDHALVVFTADHGEEFWDHGDFEHGHSVYDELIHVPLAVWAPGLAPRRVDAPVSLVDVAPTILDAVGLPAPDDLDGISLWPALTRGEAIPPRVTLAESPLYLDEALAVMEWPWKFVLVPEQGRRELYQLENDPGETTDVADRNRDVMKRLETIAAERSAARDDVDAPGVELDDATREALRALGYVD